MKLAEALEAICNEVHKLNVSLQHLQYFENSEGNSLIDVLKGFDADCRDQVQSLEPCQIIRLGEIKAKIEESQEMLVETEALTLACLEDFAKEGEPCEN